LAVHDQHRHRVEHHQRINAQKSPDEKVGNAYPAGGVMFLLEQAKKKKARQGKENLDTDPSPSFDQVKECVFLRTSEMEPKDHQEGHEPQAVQWSQVQMRGTGARLRNEIQ
jgi:hypothetical protein